MSERMRMTVLALLTGLYAAAAVILAPIDLTEPEQFFGYFKFAAIGIFLAPPALLAFCAVLGPGRWTIRLPLIAWLTCLLGLLLAYGARRGDFGYGLSSDPAEWISFCFGGPLAEYLILLPPLALLRFVRSWRLQAPNIDAAQGCQTMASSPSAVMPRADSQFTVRSLLIWTLAAASILAGLRWVLAEKGLGGNTWGEIVLAGLAQGAMLGILLTLAALPVLSIAWLFLAWQRRLLPRLALATVTAAGIAAVLAWQWSMDHDTGTLLVVAVIEA
ncbi:MAG TPA: hypothetical protein VFW87_18955, partial [Pirellulales bacterium]|nr:hypothetical protein [Pirellulales bacterium]